MDEINSKPKLKKCYRASLVKKIPTKHTGGDIYDQKNLKKVLTKLRQMKREKRYNKQKKYCLGVQESEVRTDLQVKMRCHQLPNVVQELRKTILRQDWDETVTLLMILCHPGLKLYTSVILRTCCILFFNHPRSNFQLLQNFIRLITGYVLEEDINKFISILFALRKSAITFAESGKKAGISKVTRNFEFEGL